VDEREAFPSIFLGVHKKGFPQYLVFVYYTVSYTAITFVTAHQHSSVRITVPTKQIDRALENVSDLQIIF